MKDQDCRQRPLPQLPAQASVGWRLILRSSMYMAAAGILATVAVAVLHSRVSLRRSASVLESFAQDKSISDEVASVLKHTQTRPIHLLPKEVLASRDMKKMAWRGIADKVVKEFDSVFGGSGSSKKAGKVPKISLGLRKPHTKGSTHENEKGDFLLKMGLVNKGGFVRVYQPSASAMAKASKLQHTSAAQSQQHVQKRQEEQKAVGEAKALMADERKEMEKLARDKTHLEAELARVKLEKREAQEKQDVKLSQKHAAVARRSASISNTAATAEKDKAVEDINAAVAKESKLASQWGAESEGIIQHELPETAIPQTREAGMRIYIYISIHRCN